MSNYGLTYAEELEVAALYSKKTSTGKRKYTQEELSRLFHVAPVTIRRALAEHGLLELTGYKTRKETELLKLLKEYGVDTPEDLEMILDESTATC